MIRKKYIRSVNPYAKLIPNSKNIFVGVSSPSPEKLKLIGFSDELRDGDSILPEPIGAVSLYNAEGKYIIHRDQPLETAYRTVEWHWVEWHGRYNQVKRTDFRDVSYKRYPRSFMSPPSLQLSIFTNTEGQRVVLAPLIKDWQKNKTELVHAVNLILEYFGECTFYDENRDQIIKSSIRQLNWKILPKGKHPFSVIREQLEDVLLEVPKGKRNFADRRLESINSFEPEFTAIGQGGFSGYVIFGFPAKGVYVLESVLYGNATYILGDDWEKISILTKAEILSEGLHIDRYVHLRNWFHKIKQLLN